MEGGAEADDLSALAAGLLQKITHSALAGMVLVRICSSSGLEFQTRDCPLEAVFPHLLGLGVADQSCRSEAESPEAPPLGNTTIRLVFAQVDSGSDISEESASNPPTRREHCKDDARRHAEAELAQEEVTIEYRVGRECREMGLRAVPDDTGAHAHAHAAAVSRGLLNTPRRKHSCRLLDTPRARKLSIMHVASPRRSEASTDHPLRGRARVLARTHAQ